VNDLIDVAEVGRSKAMDYDSCNSNQKPEPPSYAHAWMETVNGATCFRTWSSDLVALPCGKGVRRL